MITHPPSHPEDEHTLVRLLDRRYLGICARYWLITGAALVLCFSIYEVSDPVTPNAFDQPGAQIPNQVRSPWGVKNPL
ncbi:MAG TPA: hypothetical protein VGF92_21205 [Stellaceae bacterium]|jgi:hypothetical protein